ELEDLSQGLAVGVHGGDRVLSREPATLEQIGGGITLRASIDHEWGPSGCHGCARIGHQSLPRMLSSSRSIFAIMRAFSASVRSSRSRARFSRPDLAFGSAASA